MRTPTEVERDYAPDVEGFAEIVPAFAEALDQRGVVDFDHQIIRCVDVLLSDPDARAAARRACGVLLVDEFQDLTRRICLMVRAAGRPGRVSVRGGRRRPDHLRICGSVTALAHRLRTLVPGSGPASAPRQLPVPSSGRRRSIQSAVTQPASHHQTHRGPQRASRTRPATAASRPATSTTRARLCSSTSRSSRRGLRQRGHRCAVLSQQHTAGTPDRFGRGRHREHRPGRAAVLGTHRGGRRAGLAETRYQRQPAPRRGVGRRSTATTPRDLTPSRQLDRRNNATSRRCGVSPDV